MTTFRPVGGIWSWAFMAWRGLPRLRQANLPEGAGLEVEPQLGPNDQIIDQRIAPWFRSAYSIETSTSLTEEARHPVLLPLGEVDGRRIGLVAEAEAVEVTGADEDGEKVN